MSDEEDEELAPSALRPEDLKSIIEQSTPDLSSFQREGEEIRGASLNVEQSERARLARRPYIRHLESAITVDNQLSASVGQTVIIDRRCTLLAGAPWLDTRQLVIGRVDLEKGVARGFDESAKHWVHFGWDPKHMTEVRLLPQSGKDPWRVPSSHRKLFDAFMEETMAVLSGSSSSPGMGQTEKGGGAVHAKKRRIMGRRRRRNVDEE